MIEATKTFTALSEEFVELYFKHDPVAATLAGVHDYDHLLPDHSPEGMLSRMAWLRDLDQRLVLGVNWQELSTEQERIEHASGRARIGFAQYQDFLDRDLDAKIGGTFAISERWMNYKLEREHLLNFDCAKLKALGEEQVAKTLALLEAEAKKLD